MHRTGQLQPKPLNLNGLRSKGPSGTSAPQERRWLLAKAKLWHRADIEGSSSTSLITAVSSDDSSHDASYSNRTSEPPVASRLGLQVVLIAALSWTSAPQTLCGFHKQLEARHLQCVREIR